MQWQLPSPTHLPYSPDGLIGHFKDKTVSEWMTTEKQS